MVRSYSRLFTPGPTEIPPEVQLAMAYPMIHHRTETFSSLFGETREGLASVFQTSHAVIILAATGTGGMEASISNFFSPGDHLLIVDAGKFGKRWAEISFAFGLQTTVLKYPPGIPADPTEVQSVLKKHPDVAGVCITASETSTATYHPVEQIAQVVHEHSRALVVVDGMTAMAIHDVRTDAWELDVVVGGSQKGFMLPPGLTFVSVSDRAWERAKSARLPRYYFDLQRERKEQDKSTTAYTPAVSLVRGCHKVCELLLREGLNQVFSRHQLLTFCVHAAVKAMGLSLIAESSPSYCLTAIGIVPNVGADKVRKHLEFAHGMLVAEGQDELKGKIIRVAHFGALTLEDITACMSALEMTLRNFGVPISPGVSATAIATYLVGKEREWSCSEC